MSDNTSDEQLRALTERARGGDEQAFARLVGETRGRVFRWAFTMTGSGDEAEDVVQEVFVRVHRSLSRFRSDSRFSTWLYRITRNVVTTLARRDDARSRMADRVRQAGVGDVRVPGVVEEMAGREAVAMVRVFLTCLPPRQREVLDLVDLQGRSAAEVGEMLSLEPSTVRVHLLRARRTLRARILDARPEFVEELKS